MEVDPDVLLFTQDSIKSRFRPPHGNVGIDDAVNSILRGKKKASDFTRLEVVEHEGRLWSLDNRRLWVFKKARVPSIMVDIVSYNHRDRFPDLMQNKPELKKRILQKGYWPDVRGYCQKEFPLTGISRHPPPTPRPIHVNEEPKDGIPDYPRRPIGIVSEWRIPGRSFAENPAIKPNEDVDEEGAAEVQNDTGSHNKIFVGLTIIIAVLIWVNLGRAGDSKLLRVVKGMSASGQKSAPPATGSSAANISRRIASMLFWVLNETLGRLISTVISWTFRVVWGLMWRLLFGW